jgi:hypothetical protein
VLVVEPAIKLRASVDDPPIDRRTNRDGSGPVLGGQRQFHRAQVHLGHRNETLFPQQGSPSFFIFEAHGAQQQAALKIKFLPV